MKDRKIRAVIIDDEQGCISNLKLHINDYCPDIEIIATGRNAKEAIEIINNEPFDLAFLDVRIFDNNIFDILSRCNAIGFEIVFVTAYEHYALKAFKVAALDYIMKPLLPADIETCYQKIRKRFYGIPEITEDEPKSKSEKKLLLKQGDHTFLIKQENIFFFKAKGFYTEVFYNLNGKRAHAIISKPLGTLQKEYNATLFYRVHKSYLINIEKITAIVRTDELQVKIEDHELIPVAHRRASEFFSKIKHF